MSEAKTANTPSRDARRHGRRRRQSGEDAERSLDALRSAIVGPEQTRLEQLESRAPLDSDSVGAVLPEAVGLATGARERDLAIALEPTVTHAVTSVAKHRPELYAEALAPTIGAAVKRAVAEALAAMLERFDAALQDSLSVQSLKWRFEAKRTGRPLAEVIVLKTLAYRVEQVFLIHEPSSLVLQHLVDPAVRAHGPDQVAAMLSALDAFGREAFEGVAPDAHLQSFQMGDLVVWIGREPPVVLAAVVRGTATSEVRAQMTDTLARVRITCQEILADFTGEVARFDITRPLLEPLVRFERRKAPRRAGVLLAVAAAIIVVLLGAWIVRGRLRDRAIARTERAYVTSLAREPGIVVDRVTWARGLATISGFRDPLAKPAAAVLDEQRLPPASLALAPFVSLDPRIVDRRARSILRAPPSVTSAVDGSSLKLAGVAPRAWIDEALLLGRALPGVASIDTAGLRSKESLDTLEAAARNIGAQSVGFDAGRSHVRDARAMNRVAETALSALQAAVAAHTGACLEVVGHADPTGTDEQNRLLSSQRARAVADRLVQLGVDASFLEASGGAGGTRSVTFRLPIDPERSAPGCGGGP